MRGPPSHLTWNDPICNVRDATSGETIKHLQKILWGCYVLSHSSFANESRTQMEQNHRSAIKTFIPNYAAKWLYNVRRPCEM